MSATEVTSHAKNYIQYHYGNLLSLDEPLFNENEKIWSIKLKMDYPRLVQNDEPEERFVRTLFIKDLGTLFYNEDFKLIRDKSTSRLECLNLLRSRLRTWDEMAESIVVKTSASQLARTPMARHFLHPISTILANFFQDDSRIISFDELRHLRRTDRYVQWIRLLEDLKLVRRIDEGFTYGNMFTELRRRATNSNDFLTYILAYVLRTRYPVLRDVFQLWQFEPLVHLDSCYYRPALEARKVIFQRAESLFSRYLRTYPNRARFELSVVLFELCNSKALNKKDHLYYANEELFAEMLDLSEEYSVLSSPRI